MSNDRRNELNARINEMASATAREVVLQTHSELLLVVEKQLRDYTFSLIASLRNLLRSEEVCEESSEELCEQPTGEVCIMESGGKAISMHDAKWMAAHNAMVATNGNKMHAARLLGINVKTLYNIIGKNGAWKGAM